LGDPKQKWLMAAGIDRYLVNIGHKQLFATQAAKPQGEGCWCLEPVETTFPEQRRVEYAKRGLMQALEWISDLNKHKPGCETPKQCRRNWNESPTGTVLGFW